MSSSSQRPPLPCLYTPILKSVNDGVRYSNQTPNSGPIIFHGRCSIRWSKKSWTRVIRRMVTINHLGKVTPYGDTDLGASCHYLNQCCLIINIDPWHVSGGNFINCTSAITHKIYIENESSEFVFTPFLRQWVDKNSCAIYHCINWNCWLIVHIF